MQRPEDRILTEYNKKMQKNEEKLQALEWRRDNIEKKEDFDDQRRAALNALKKDDK